MATYAFPAIAPNSLAVELVHSSTRFQSETSGAVQVNALTGMWRLTMSWQSLKNPDRAELRAFLAKLRGGFHRFTVQNYEAEQRGAFGGTPVVDGAGQVGNSIAVRGGSNNITNWIRAGDFFSFNNELKMATDDASTDGTGDVTINFVPEIHNSPADGVSIVTTQPAGKFLLLEDRVAWSSTPGVFSSLTIVALEDVL